MALYFRPTGAAADDPAYLEKVEMLTDGVAVLAPDDLEKAAERWMREKRFLPRAAELIDMAKASLTAANHHDGRPLQAIADEYNSRIAHTRRHGEILWRVAGDRLWLDFLR